MEDTCYFIILSAQWFAENQALVNEKVAEFGEDGALRRLVSEYGTPDHGDMAIKQVCYLGALRPRNTVIEIIF
jgi:hypothetical protein